MQRRRPQAYSRREKRHRYPATAVSSANVARHSFLPRETSPAGPERSHSVAVRRKYNRLRPAECSPLRDRPLMTWFGMPPGCPELEGRRAGGGGREEEDGRGGIRIETSLRHRAFPPRHSAGRSGADSHNRNRRRHRAMEHAETVSRPPLQRPICQGSRDPDMIGLLACS